MGAHSKSKGKRGEREIVALAREFRLSAERTCTQRNTSTPVSVRLRRIGLFSFDADLWRAPAGPKFRSRGSRSRNGDRVGARSTSEGTRIGAGRPTHMHHDKFLLASRPTANSKVGILGQ